MTIKKIEDSSDESSSEDIIKTIIVEIARNLLKVSIYPSQDEFRDETEKVLKNSFPEFYKKFRQNQFFIFYEKNIYQRLIAKHQSYRGSLTSRIKDALHHIFPELPSITSRAPHGSGQVGSTALPDPKHRVGSGNGSKRVRMGQTGLKFDKSVFLEISRRISLQSE